MDSDRVDVAVRLVVQNRYATLATQSVNDLGESGVWASAVAYAWHSDASLVWYSDVSSVHSRNIATHANVALTIFNSTEPSAQVNGLQAVAEVSTVAAEELPEIALHYFAQSFPDAVERERWMQPVEAFQGSAPLRFYRAQRSRAYVLGGDGDARVAVPLPALRRRLTTHQGL